MKLTHYVQRITLALLMVLLAVSCADERIDFGIDDDGDVPPGMVRITLNPTLEAPSTVVTRTAPSAADKALTAGSIYVLVFDGTTPSSTLLQKPATATFAADKLKATLNQQTTDCYLYVVANISAEEKLYLDALGAGTTMGEVANTLKHRLQPSPNDYISSPLPMSGCSAATKLVKTADTTPLTVTIPLTRSVARIDIDGTEPSFSIYGASVADGAPYGHTMALAILPSFSNIDLKPYSERTITAATVMTDVLFCYENAGSTDEADSRATRVVIQGKPATSSAPSYYPIDIVYPDPADPSNKTLAHIERNKCYTIKLTKVDIDGYRTAEEAARSESFNNRLEMDIIVTDPYAHDITTNGKQFMGVTNSEFVLYPREDATVKYVHITSFSYTCDPGWAAGTITLPAGLTLSSGVSPRLDVSPTVTQRDVVVDVASNFTEGVIVIHIGNLRKEIKVRQMGVSLPTGDMFENYFVAPNVMTDFKIGEIISPSADTKWLQVSASADIGLGGASMSDRVTNPAGGIYIHVEPNAGFNGSAQPREAYLYVSGEKDNQRIKVFVQQKVIDVYSEATQIGPYSYVGTFHRWNETGERLIRIDANTHFNYYKEGTGAIWWEATVIAGRDFIVLDQTRSSDSRVKIGPSPLSSTSELNAFGTSVTSAAASSAEVESYQVESIKRTVKGSNGNVYFRVGLTGKLSGPAAQPRYGLIGITYGAGATREASKKTQTHFIYVRQGEAADYVMRPWDPSTKPLQRTKINGDLSEHALINDLLQASRPAAVKFTPYNLTSPQPIPNVARGYLFVDHPSQGGYYFAPLAPFAYGPITTEGLTLARPANASTVDLYSPQEVEFMESCPPGYRRPGIGSRTSKVTDNGGSVSNLLLSDISSAEFLHSLFLYPKKQVLYPDLSNQLRGYLADGFFDRRRIYETVDNVVATDYRIKTDPNSFELSKAWGIVRSDFKSDKSTPDAGMAFWGYITFNPYNYASIFTPFTGAGNYSESENIAKISAVGGSGSLHSASRKLNAITYHLRIGYTSLGTILGKNDQSYTFDINFTGLDYGSIRCVKDEQPLIGTGDKKDPSIEDIPAPDAAQLAIRHRYNTDRSGTLQSQIEADYNTLAERKRINSISISGNKELIAADYTYLNDWASGTTYGADAKLRHLIIRGVGNPTIYANSFTSSKWSSITLRDASEIKSGAFTSGVTAMSNLYLGCLDDMTIAPGAFVFTTTGVQLHLQASGKEYKDHTLGTPKKLWQPGGYGSAIEWQTIKAEN